MGTLVGASVFSTGFLSARVHEALRDATERARQIDDRLVDGGARGESVSVDALGEQREDLRHAVQDQFASLVIGVNLGFAVALVVLAVFAAAEPGDLGRADTAALVAFVVAGWAIVGVGCLDFLGVRRALERRLQHTLLERLSVGEGLLYRAAESAADDRFERLREVEDIAGGLVDQTRGRWTDALSFHARARLARLYAPEYDLVVSDADVLRLIDAELGEVCKEDPEYRWWWTWARVAEARNDFEESATRWIAGFDALGGGDYFAWSRRQKTNPVASIVRWHTEPAMPETWLAVLGQLEEAGRLGDLLVSSYALPRLIRALRKKQSRIEPAIGWEPDWGPAIRWMTLTVEAGSKIMNDYSKKLLREFIVEYTDEANAAPAVADAAKTLLARLDQGDDARAPA